MSRAGAGASSRGPGPVLPAPGPANHPDVATTTATAGPPVATVPTSGAPSQDTAMNERDVRIELPPEERFLQVARLAVVSLASTSGLDHRRVDELRVAVDELCFQLVQGGDRAAPLRVRIAARPGGIRVTAERDTGEHLPLDEGPLPDVDGLDVRVDVEGDTHRVSFDLVTDDGTGETS